jgi:hypothetical protein
MTSDTELPSSPAVSGETKRRGRPPGQSGTESPEQKVERIRQELRQAEAALKASEEKRASIIGTAALRHARRHEEFRRHLAAALRAEVKAKGDLAVIGDLIADAAPPS